MGWVVFHLTRPSEHIRVSHVYLETCGLHVGALGRFLKTAVTEGRFASGELYLKWVFCRVPRNFPVCLPTASSKTRVKFCYYGRFHLDEIMREEKQVFLSFIIGMDVVWNPRFLPVENRTFYTLAVCSLWG